jgi:hypothetical protein
MNSQVFSMSSEVTIEFDFLLIHEGTYDDVTFTIGDIADGLGLSSAGELLSLKLAEAASIGVAATLNSGLGSSGRLDTTGTRLTDDTWYHATFTWTPTSGTTGDAAFTVNDFSADVYTLSTTGFTFDSDSAQIGFGSVNDSIRFDNVDMNIATDGDTTPPAAPTGLCATAGDGLVSLNWADNSEGDFGSYSVYRSTTSSNYSTALATGLSSSDYVDNSALNGTTYYYVVTATDTNSNESAQSSEVYLPQVGPVVLWRDADVPFKFADFQLLANSTDPGGSDLSLDWISGTSTNGRSVTQSGRWITYNSPTSNTNVDYVAFRIVNASGGSDTAVAEIRVMAADPGTDQTRNIAEISVQGSDILIKFIGIPGRTYNVQASTNLATGVWQNIGECTIGEAGNVIFTETNSPAGSRFYRTVSP